MHDGYTDLPPGKLASVVTYLEMRTRPPLQATPTTSDFNIRRVTHPDLDWYRELYREIGEPWLWFSRLRISDDELRGILYDPAVDVFALSHAGADHGLLEFDRRRLPGRKIGRLRAGDGDDAGRRTEQKALNERHM